jgi:hypothetical protein
MASVNGVRWAEIPQSGKTLIFPPTRSGAPMVVDDDPGYSGVMLLRSNGPATVPANPHAST